MVIETSRLILRPWEDTDAEDLFAYARDERVGPAAGWPPHTSVEDSARVIREVLSAPETYAVCLKEDGRAIGSIGLMIADASDLGLSDTEAEIGYWIGVPFWGRGLIPEAVRALITHGFLDLHLETLWCGYYEGNEKSRRVQEKCGFTYHHTNENVPCELMGDIRTEHDARLTRGEWAQNLPLRWLDESEQELALDLARRVFTEFNAPEYDPEALAEFERTTRNEALLSDLAYLGVFDEGALVAMLAYNHVTSHVVFFFVDGRYHGLGLGTRLFHRFVEDTDAEVIKLNSTPVAVPFYRHLGFRETAPEQTVRGIRSTQMTLWLR